jgi:hypothetical protein
MRRGFQAYRPFFHRDVHGFVLPEGAYLSKLAGVLSGPISALRDFPEQVCFNDSLHNVFGRVGSVG